ncbi:MAG: hypothetical protein WAN48_12350 [Actinomycetes bacterium]
MSARRRWVSSLVASVLAVSGLVAVAVWPASAATPPFDPASNGATAGALTLYDTSGNVVTTGALSDAPAYAMANTDTGRSGAGDSLATLYAATPVEGQNALSWPTSQVSVTSTYPATSGVPASLLNKPTALVQQILVWLDPSDAGSYAAAYPNTNATASWQNLYQLRMVTSGAQPGNTEIYASATIQIDTTASTWTQVYPDASSSAPTVDVPAAVTGMAKVGKTLTCSAAFTGADSTTYQWQRNTADIATATSSSYKAVPADVGKNVRCVATGSNTFGDTPSTSAAKKIAAGDALQATTRPSVSGTAKPGNKLTCKPGAWTPKASSYSYNWLRNGKAIRGQTAKTYKVVRGDIGDKISCRVTAKRAGYKNGVVASKPVTVKR